MGNGNRADWVVQLRLRRRCERWRIVFGVPYPAVASSGRCGLELPGNRYAHVPGQYYDLI